MVDAKGIVNSRLAFNAPNRFCHWPAGTPEADLLGHDAADDQQHKLRQDCREQRCPPVREHDKQRLSEHDAGAQQYSGGDAQERERVPAETDAPAQTARGQFSHALPPIHGRHHDERRQRYSQDRAQ